ncbi:MAG: hypothetical protein K5979_15330 [Ruminococcus sp.]|nr:hypothetical protein [Ruminococcus sp.]
MNGSPEKPRSLWEVAADLEDVLIGLERAQKAAYIFLEDMTDEFLSPQNYPDFYGKGRLEEYTTSLYLVEDRVFNERARLEKLKNELYELNREQKKAPAPPEKHLTIISIQERGLAYELTA